MQLQAGTGKRKEAQVETGTSTDAVLSIQYIKNILVRCMNSLADERKRGWAMERSGCERKQSGATCICSSLTAWSPARFTCETRTLQSPLVIKWSSLENHLHPPPVVFTGAPKGPWRWVSQKDSSRDIKMIYPLTPWFQLWNAQDNSFKRRDGSCIHVVKPNKKMPIATSFLTAKYCRQPTTEEVFNDNMDSFEPLASKKITEFSSEK